MCDFFVVPVHKANDILLIKSANVYTFFIIKAIYKLGVFNNQHPLGFTFINHVVSQTLLVVPCKGILGVGAKLAVIGWIKEYKIIGLGLNLLKELFKVQIIYLCS